MTTPQSEAWIVAEWDDEDDEWYFGQACETEKEATECLRQGEYVLYRATPIKKIKVNATSEEI